MRGPSDAELAAIAAAYAVFLARTRSAPAPAPSRWRAAARVEAVEAGQLR